MKERRCPRWKRPADVDEKMIWVPCKIEQLLRPVLYRRTRYCKHRWNVESLRFFHHSNGPLWEPFHLCLKSQIFVVERTKSTRRMRLIVALTIGSIAMTKKGGNVINAFFSMRKFDLAIREISDGIGQEFPTTFWTVYNQQTADQ